MINVWCPFPFLWILGSGVGVTASSTTTILDSTTTSISSTSTTASASTTTSAYVEEPTSIPHLEVPEISKPNQLYTQVKFEKRTGLVSNVFKVDMYKTTSAVGGNRLGKGLSMQCASICVRDGQKCKAFLFRQTLQQCEFYKETSGGGDYFNVIYVKV